MGLKKGDEYTGDELEDLGYEINPRCCVLESIIGEHSFIIVDLGNDNWKISEVLK